MPCELEKRIRESIADMFNRLLPRRDLYEPEAWDGVELGDEASMLLDRGIGGLGQSDIARLNRLLIEAAFPFLEGGILDHRAGFLFETYISYWLRHLVDVGIALFDLAGRWTTCGLRGVTRRVGSWSTANPVPGRSTSKCTAGDLIVSRRT